MDHFNEAERRLVTAMTVAARGPRQNGVFALWLTVRLCDGLVPPPVLKDRDQRDRLAHARRRVAGLSVPAPLRRALAGAYKELEIRGAASVPVALQQLVAPAREALGPDSGEAMSLAARLARTALRSGSAITV